MVPELVIDRELLTQGDCLAKAAEMDARAEACGPSHQAADFVNMARCWRVLAAQAAWQDAP